MWDLPGPGLEPVSPALAGGFLTTAPPGKPQHVFLNQVSVFTILRPYIVHHRSALFLVPHSHTSFLCTCGQFFPKGSNIYHMPIMNIFYAFKHNPLFPRSFIYAAFLLQTGCSPRPPHSCPLGSSACHPPVLNPTTAPRVCPASWPHRVEEGTWGFNHTVLRLPADTWVLVPAQAT